MRTPKNPWLPLLMFWMLGLCLPRAAAAASLQEVQGFGNNPSNARMFLSVNMHAEEDENESDEGGCSAAPGRTRGESATLLLALSVLSVLQLRRRRSASAEQGRR